MVTVGQITWDWGICTTVSRPVIVAWLACAIAFVAARGPVIVTVAVVTRAIQLDMALLTFYRIEVSAILPTI